MDGWDDTLVKMKYYLMRITENKNLGNNNFAQHGIEGIVLACAMEQVHSCQEYAEIAELEKIT